MSLSDSELVKLVTLSHNQSIIPNLNSGLVPFDYKSGFKCAALTKLFIGPSECFD